MRGCLLAAMQRACSARDPASLYLWRELALAGCSAVLLSATLHQYWHLMFAALFLQAGAPSCIATCWLLVPRIPSSLTCGAALWRATAPAACASACGEDGAGVRALSLLCLLGMLGMLCRHRQSRTLCRLWHCMCGHVVAPDWLQTSGSEQDRIRAGCCMSSASFQLLCTTCLLQEQVPPEVAGVAGWRGAGAA